MNNLNPLFEYQNIESRAAGRAASKKIAMIRRLDTDRRKGRKVAQFAEPLIRKGMIATGKHWSDAYRFNLPQSAVGAKDFIEYDAGRMFADQDDPVLHKKVHTSPAWHNRPIHKEVPGKRIWVKSKFTHELHPTGGINRLGRREGIYD